MRRRHDSLEAALREILPELERLRTEQSAHADERHLFEKREHKLRDDTIHKQRLQDEFTTEHCENEGLRKRIGSLETEELQMGTHAKQLLVSLEELQRSQKEAAQRHQEEEQQLQLLQINLERLRIGKNDERKGRDEADQRFREVQVEKHELRQEIISAHVAHDDLHRRWSILEAERMCQDTHQLRLEQAELRHQAALNEMDDEKRAKLDFERRYRSVCSDNLRLQDEIRKLQEASEGPPQLDEADRQRRSRECLWVHITLCLQELDKQGLPDAEKCRRLRHEMNTVKTSSIRPGRDELLSRSRLLADTKRLLQDHLQNSRST